ncbi:MAG: YbaN family protein [Mesorhizobium sp.]
MQIVWLIVGLASLVLAGLGVALPLLPTTPFVILAAFCFARSSPALHDRLLDSRTFGKALRDWRTHRAISRTGKTASVLAMALSLAASLVLTVDLAVVGLQALAVSAAAAFILTRNTAA